MLTDLILDLLSSFDDNCPASKSDVFISTQVERIQKGATAGSDVYYFAFQANGTNAACNFPIIDLEPPQGSLHCDGFVGVDCGFTLNYSEYGSFYFAGEKQ